MPLTDEECRHCGRTIHTDDQIEGKCLGCGIPLEEEYSQLIMFYAEELKEMEEQAQEKANLKERDIVDEGDHSTGRYEAIIEVEKKLKDRLQMNHGEIMKAYNEMTEN